jgi:hypothetical protein
MSVSFPYDCGTTVPIARHSSPTSRPRKATASANAAGRNALPACSADVAGGNQIGGKPGFCTGGLTPKNSKNAAV